MPASISAQIAPCSSRFAAASAIAAANTGNKHVQVLQFKLSSSGADLAPVTAAEAAYVLPGQSREWQMRFTSALAAGATVRVEARTDAGDMQADVVVSGS